MWRRGRGDRRCEGVIHVMRWPLRAAGRCGDGRCDGVDHDKMVHGGVRRCDGVVHDKEVFAGVMPREQVVAV